jgi:hypothetical protein
MHAATHQPSVQLVPGKVRVLSIVKALLHLEQRSGEDEVDGVQSMLYGCMGPKQAYCFLRWVYWGKRMLKLACQGKLCKQTLHGIPHVCCLLLGLQQHVEIAVDHQQ